MSFLSGLRTGILAATSSVLLTILVDTYFWQDLAKAKPENLTSAFVGSLQAGLRREGPGPQWPELHALLFNVVEGKSSEWGVSPWHSYVTSLIPKLLAFTAPLVIIGVLRTARNPPTASAIDARANFLLLIALTHIAILSMLGHKEWRFAFYVVPALNVVATVGASNLTRSWPGKAILAGLIFLQVGLSLFTGYLSTINYPGGQALKLLHEQVGSGCVNDSDGQVEVHIDVLPAMTGVTLFQSVHLQRDRSSGLVNGFAGIVPPTCESGARWVYDKTEDLPTIDQEAAAAWSSFTHLLTDAPECRILHSRNPTADQKGVPLANAEQPFEPISPPVSSFGGLRRKSVSQFRRDLLSLPRATLACLPLIGSPEKSAFGNLIRLALPVVILEEPAVWLCRRKDANSL